jgi:hypothetical protein
MPDYHIDIRRYLLSSPEGAHDFKVDYSKYPFSDITRAERRAHRLAPL